MESERDLRSKFIKAIDGDSPLTKLWKYRSFIQRYPKEATSLKDKMLDLAIKNKLTGEYELIFRLLGVPQSSISRSGEYGRLKDELMPIINNLKLEAQNYESIQKVEQEVRAYNRLGEMLAQMGDHKESEHFYSRIIRKQAINQVIREEELLPNWGRELFYMIDDPQGLFKDSHDYNELQIFSIRNLGDKKKMNSTLALLRDVYKLTKKGRGKAKAKVFENLKSDHFSSQDIMNNGIMSLLDLGFLYSILGLAHCDRATLKQDVKWSSKIQIAYLQADYKKLFSDVHRQYDNYGRFNPTVQFVYQDCHRQITKRILSEVLSAYQKISFLKIEEITGLKAGTVQIFLRENPSLPYLFDPITQSVVYYQKNVALYEEALSFYNVIREKYQQKQRILLIDSKESFEDIQMEMELGKRSSQGRGRQKDRMF